MASDLMPPSAGNDPVVPAPATVDRIRRTFVEALGLNVDPEALPYEDMLDDTAGLDSVAILEFVVALEQEFGIELEPERLSLDCLRDLGRLASYIQARTLSGSRTNHERPGSDRDPS